MADLLSLPAKYSGGLAPSVQANIKPVKNGILALPAKYSAQGVETNVDASQLTRPENIGDTYAAGPPIPAQPQWSGQIASPVGAGTGLGGSQEDTTLRQIANVVTGADRETAYTENLPEYSLDVEAYVDKPLESIKATVGMLIANTPEGKKNMVLQRFPNAQFFDDDKGNVIVELPSGEQAVLDKPGMSKGDAYKLAFETAWFLGPGKVASAAKSVAGKTVTGGLANAAAEFGKQKIGQATGTGEETDLVNVGIAGVAGAGSEFIPAKLAAGKIKKAEKITGVAKERVQRVPALVSEAEDITAETGQIFARPQQTGDLFDLEEMSKAAAETGKGQEFLRAQNKNATQSVVRFTKMLSKSKDAKGSYIKVRDAAAQAIKNVENVRSQAVRPLYRKARADTNFHSIPQTKNFIRNELKDLPATDEYYKALQEVNKSLVPINVGGGKATRGLRMPQLVTSYKLLNKKISKEAGKLDGDANLIRELTGLRKQMSAEISGKNDFFKQANETYSRLSKPVEKLRNGIVGDVAKLKDKQVKGIRTKLLDNGLFNANPNEINSAKRAISKVDPKAWDGIIREEFRTRIQNKVKDRVFSISDRPAEFLTALGGPKGRDISMMRSAMNSESRKRYDYLIKGLERQSKGRPGGSQTDIRKVIGEKWKEGAATKWARLMSPREKVQTAAEQAAYDKNRDIAADLIFNPKWSADWKQLNRLAPNSKASATKFQEMIGVVGKVIKAAAVSQSPDSPAATRKALEILNKE